MTHGRDCHCQEMKGLIAAARFLEDLIEDGEGDGVMWRPACWQVTALKTILRHVRHVNRHVVEVKAAVEDASDTLKSLVDRMSSLKNELSKGNAERVALTHVYERGNDVDLVHTDEAGGILWALDCTEDEGYWVNAFNTKAEALAYAKSHTLHVKKKYCVVRNCQFHTKDVK